MARTIGYWTATGLLAAAYLFGGVVDAMGGEEVQKGAEKFGYPVYFFLILGVWKLGAAVVLVAPALPRLKEWAYAGILFNLTGAAATHVFAKDPPGEAIPALVVLAIAGTSWALRPASRKLAGPWL